MTRPMTRAEAWRYIAATIRPRDDHGLCTRVYGLRWRGLIDGDTKCAMHIALDEYFTDGLHPHDDFPYVWTLTPNGNAERIYGALLLAEIAEQEDGQ